MAEHECVDDLANLRPFAGDMEWRCNKCEIPVQIWEVIEALRVRAVARDAAYRLRAGDVEVAPL